MGIPHDSTEAFDTIWEPCGGCWGQRVIWSPAPGGLASRACPSCLGIGQRAVMIGAPTWRPQAA